MSVFDARGHEVVAGDDVTLSIQKTSGSEDYVPVTDPGANQLMTETLKELKIMNLHLSIMTDNDIQRTDVEI